LAATKKKIIVFIVFLLALIAFIVSASSIVMPKRYDLGANWGAFDAEKENTMDVMFFGSSLAYCNIIPAVIWEDSGISSYTMGGPEQTLGITYYYIKEMFRHQNPSAVFVEISGIIDPPYTSTTKINIGYMPYNCNRFSATIQTAEKEEWLGLFFPLYNYHDRWPDLSDDDYELGLTGYDIDLLAGYNFLSDSEEQNEPRQRNFEQSEEDYQNNMQSLQKITALCQAHNCRVIFYVTASYAYFEANYLSQLKQDIAAMDGAEFHNFIEDIDQLDLDPKTDFHDILHFNYRGAEKFSKFISGYMADIGISATEAYGDNELWQKRLDYYHDLIAQAKE